MSSAGRATGKIILTGQDLECLPSQVYDVDVPLPSKASKGGPGVKDGEEPAAWWGFSEVSKIDASRNRYEVK